MNKWSQYYLVRSFCCYTLLNYVRNVRATNTRKTDTHTTHKFQLCIQSIEHRHSSVKVKVEKF